MLYEFRKSVAIAVKKYSIRIVHQQFELLRILQNLDMAISLMFNHTGRSCGIDDDVLI